MHTYVRIRIHIRICTHTRFGPCIRRIRSAIESPWRGNLILIGIAPLGNEHTSLKFARVCVRCAGGTIEVKRGKEKKIERKKEKEGENEKEKEGKSPGVLSACSRDGAKTAALHSNDDKSRGFEDIGQQG